MSISPARIYASPMLNCGMKIEKPTVKTAN